MRKEIRINENGLEILFQIREDGVVELCNFSASGAAAARRKCADERGQELVYPVLEIQLTGQSSRNMHAYKHNMSSASLDLHYKSHEMLPRETGKELCIIMETEYGLEAVYHMRLYDRIPVAQVWAELVNRGTEELGLEYVSSFFYQGISANGRQPYFDKTDIYLPFNSWSCEAQWKKLDVRDLNLTGMPVDGFRMPGFGNNRFAYTGKGSWSACEYLPMGFAQDRETDEIYFFQIEHSGEWHVEYGSGVGGRLYLALSGPTESEHGWWKNLKAGMRFMTVPTAVGVIRSDLSGAVAALTGYRRTVRRENDDDKKLFVVFNDYMNCLSGDPTEEREKEIIDKAAEMGCEYYCLDCGWYDKGYWWDRVGEWKESLERFPNSLKSVCDYAGKKGLKMGLWLEIEVMGVACELAETLPDDWFVFRHGKRYIDNKRYLLDFRNPEVRKYCMAVMTRLIEDYGISYFKMDYNVTMGYGSELSTDSPADAILEHYRCLYRWYEELFQKYPELVVENCGSGGLRMDYGMLKLLSLQSTSDQTDYIYNSYIASNVASAVTPEQAGMWVYPYEDNREHIIYNMVNGLLLRPYMSGMVWKLSDEGMELLKEGIALYKEIRGELKEGFPVFPLGFNDIKSDVLAYGVYCGRVLYLAVFTPRCDNAVIPLAYETTGQVKVIYPKAEECEYCCKEGELRVRMPQKAAARLFKIELK